MRISKISIIALSVVVIVLALLFYANPEYTSLVRIKNTACQLNEFVQTRYLWAILLFLVICIVLMSVCLPLVGPIAIVGGSLFGWCPGVLYSTLGIITGVSISFLFMRYALTQFVVAHYSSRLAAFRERVNIYGYTYLISLHLLTVVPYFLITVIAVIADVPFSAFLWTSIVGTLPLIIIYAFAGKELCMIQSWRDVMSVHMLILFFILAVLALLPMVARRFKLIG